jgi:hypothetical protein
LKTGAAVAPVFTIPSRINSARHDDLMKAATRNLSITSTDERGRT